MSDAVAIRERAPAMTTHRVEAAIRRLDRLIDRAEHDERYCRDPGELRALIALRRLRTDLDLLLVARRLEAQKKLVSLARWRDGFRCARVSLHRPRG